MRNMESFEEQIQDHIEEQSGQLEDVVEAHERTNFILWVNTGFTILAGVASLAIAILTLLQ